MHWNSHNSGANATQNNDRPSDFANIIILRQSSVARSLTKFQEKALAAKSSRADTAAYKAFKEFDVNGDGTIAVSELGNLVEVLGKKLSKEIVTQIVEQCDKDADSTLTLEEFKDFYHRFNEERQAEHRKQALLTREHLSSRDFNVSFSMRCRRTCVGATEIGCCVFYKQLLLLVSAIVMALMIPLFGATYRVRRIRRRCQNTACVLRYYYYFLSSHRSNGFVSMPIHPFFFSISFTHNQTRRLTWTPLTATCMHSSGVSIGFFPRHGRLPATTTRFRIAFQNGCWWPSVWFTAVSTTT